MSTEVMNPIVYGTIKATCSCCSNNNTKVMLCYSLNNTNKLERRASTYLEKELQEMLDLLLAKLPANDVMRVVLQKEKVEKKEKKVKSLIALLKYLDDFEAQKYSDGETNVRTRYFI